MPANALIDLYSDTQTRPTSGMRKAIADAEVGDEQRGEDPSTNRLQDRVAEMLGKEAAVFMPSGTMCNQIALLVHCRRGEEVTGSDRSHVFRSEGGGGSALAGVQTWPIPTEQGLFTAAELEKAVHKPTRYQPGTRLVVIEQTNNNGGGVVWPKTQIEEVVAVARKHGLLVHMDGARLLNAAVAAGEKAKAFAGPCDSAWLDLSKGLGCPAGAVLAGSKTFIEAAWQWKQRMGGALRQSGVLAAAGLYALDHHVDRLAEDHSNAKTLGARVADVAGIRLDPPRIDTNIVFFDTSGTGLPAADFCERLLAKGVRMGAMGPSRIRAVTHHDVSADGIAKAVKAVAEVASEAKGGKRKSPSR